jgi:hypothetical protein
MQVKPPRLGHCARSPLAPRQTSLDYLGDYAGDLCMLSLNINDTLYKAMHEGMNQAETFG